MNQCDTPVDMSIVASIMPLELFAYEDTCLLTCLHTRIYQYSATFLHTQNYFQFLFISYLCSTTTVPLYVSSGVSEKFRDVLVAEIRHILLHPVAAVGDMPG